MRYVDTLQRYVGEITPLWGNDTKIRRWWLWCWWWWRRWWWFSQPHSL